MRFTWKSVSDVLSDKELKNALGGYGEGYGYTKCGDFSTKETCSGKCGPSSNPQNDICTWVKTDQKCKCASAG